MPIFIDYPAITISCFLFFQGTFILFNASVTNQGWTTFYASLYKAQGNDFQKMWPPDNDPEWQDVMLTPQENTIVVYKRNIIKSENPEQAIPDYNMVPTKKLLWDENLCVFK